MTEPAEDPPAGAAPAPTHGTGSEQAPRAARGTGPEQDPEAASAPVRGTGAASASSVDPATALLAQAKADARIRGRTGATRQRPRRATPAVRSGSSPDDRDPQDFSTALNRLLAQHGWELDVAVHSVMARWPEFVGPQIAEHCAPERYVDGELTVRTDSTAWATQLRLLAPQVQRRLNAELGPDTVQRISVRGPDAPRWTHGQRSVRGRGPRDTYG